MDCLKPPGEFITDAGFAHRTFQLMVYTCCSKAMPAHRQGEKLELVLASHWTQAESTTTIGMTSSLAWVASHISRVMESEIWGEVPGFFFSLANSSIGDGIQLHTASCQCIKRIRRFHHGSPAQCVLWPLESDCQLERTILSSMD